MSRFVENPEPKLTPDLIWLANDREGDCNTQKFCLDVRSKSIGLSLTFAESHRFSADHAKGTGAVLKSVTSLSISAFCSSYCSVHLDYLAI